MPTQQKQQHKTVDLRRRFGVSYFLQLCGNKGEFPQVFNSCVTEKYQCYGYFEVEDANAVTIWIFRSIRKLH